MTTDGKMRPGHFMLTNGMFATKWFQWHSVDDSMISPALCFAAGHWKMIHMTFENLACIVGSGFDVFVTA